MKDPMEGYYVSNPTRGRSWLEGAYKRFDVKPSEIVPELKWLVDNMGMDETAFIHSCQYPPQLDIAFRKLYSHYRYMWE